MTNLRIGTTEYTVQGPTPTFGTWMLTGPRGAQFITRIPNRDGLTTAFALGRGGQPYDLRDRGNRVVFQVVDGELRRA